MLKAPCYLRHLSLSRVLLAQFSETVWRVTMFLGVCEDGGLAGSLGSKFS